MSTVRALLALVVVLSILVVLVVVSASAVRKPGSFVADPARLSDVTCPPAPPYKLIGNRVWGSPSIAALYRAETFGPRHWSGFGPDVGPIGDDFTVMGGPSSSRENLDDP